MSINTRSNLAEWDCCFFLFLSAPLSLSLPLFSLLFLFRRGSFSLRAIVARNANSEWRVPVRSQIGSNVVGVLRPWNSVALLVLVLYFSGVDVGRVSSVSLSFWINIGIGRLFS